ncbi:MAG: putative aspartyl protease [Cyclobacteriaceae bacterium]|jgi:predicted aspartyl protease
MHLVLTMILSLSIHLNSKAQSAIGFIMPDEVDKIEMEFEMYSNLIVIPIRINNFLTLKFILDTGAESAIITEKLFADMLGLDYVREINIHGPGIIDSVTAFVASNVNFELKDGLKAIGLNVLVLEKDYLQLSKNLGEEVYGILGYDLFNRFVVDINYDDKVLTFYRHGTYKPKRVMDAIPIEVVSTKPYVKVVFHQNDLTDTVKMMVDTGASHAALLDINATDHLILPEKLINTSLGRGLAGEIPGYIGRINNCDVGRFVLKDLLVSIPEDGAYIKAIKRGSRHGTIGGDMLSRFHVIFDYQKEMMYLQRTKFFSEPFEHNMSGMTLITDGKQLDTLMVQEVEKNTPAYQADIRPGDYLLKINGFSMGNNSVSDINALLRRKHGLKIRAVILRDDQKIKKVFKLRRLI